MQFSQTEINTHDGTFNKFNVMPGIEISPVALKIPEATNKQAIAAANKETMQVNVANKAPDWDGFFISLQDMNKNTFFKHINDSNISLYLNESDTIQELCASSVSDRIGFNGIQVTDVIKAIPVNVLNDTISLIANSFRELSNKNVASKVAGSTLLYAIYLFAKESAISHANTGNTRFIIDSRLKFFIYPMIKFIFNVKQANA